MTRLLRNTLGRNTLGRISAMALTAPLALALAACGSDTEAGLPESEAIAAIAPPQGTQWTETVTVTPEDGYVLGNPDAPIKLMEYGSFTCSHCAVFSKEAAPPLRDKYVASGVVSYELRNQIHDAIDLTLSVMARCSGPEAFHPLAEQVWMNFESLFETIQGNREAIQAVSNAPESERFQAAAKAAGLLEFFAARGIPQEKALECLGDTKHAEAIAERSQTQGDELDVAGTPTFFINGNNIGTQTWLTLEPILQNAGAR